MRLRLSHVKIQNVQAHKNHHQCMYILAAGKGGGLGCLYGIYMYIVDDMLLGS